ncbi:hypothetical protein AB5I41_08990 [Sphingomonas sp. MMS24-JH45]
MPIAAMTVLNGLDIAEVIWKQCVGAPRRRGRQAAPMQMQMTWWPQAGTLAKLVDAIYVYRCDDPHRIATAGALLSQVMWRIEGQFAVIGRSGQPQPLYRASAMGPAASALRLETRGPVTVVGVGFSPRDGPR